MELEIAYAKSRGLNVAYSLTGDGPIDLVLAPGFVSHLEAGFELPAFERAVRRLARFARVISFDKPGTGLSDPIDGPQTLDHRMEDLTAVLDAAAVGIADRHYGQDIMACVVLRDGHACSEDELRAFCLQVLGRYKTPRIIRFVPEWPRGPSGKVQRLKLLDLL